MFPRRGFTLVEILVALAIVAVALAQLASPWPPLGSRAGEVRQGASAFVWQESVGGTPNPGFRKIEITVADPARPDYALAHLVGYLGQPPQP